MKKIKVSICTGTACFVMGASEILLLEENLSPEVAQYVEIEGVTCLDKCRNPECGKTPFVMIDGEVITEASLLSVMEKINEIVEKRQKEELNA
ncbi:MAG: hypothetical protein E7062_05010 [Spirochaetaceae bacterium]|nr:hypothetical protein [Spirochaetaceae bacterium]